MRSGSRGQKEDVSTNAHCGVEAEAPPPAASIRLYCYFNMCHHIRFCTKSEEEKIKWKQSVRRRLCLISQIMWLLTLGWDTELRLQEDGWSFKAPACARTLLVLGLCLCSDSACARTLLVLGCFSAWTDSVLQLQLFSSCSRCFCARFNSLCNNSKKQSNAQWSVYKWNCSALAVCALASLPFTGRATVHEPG